MGVNGLWKLLHTNNIEKKYRRNKKTYKLAIDISIMLYQILINSKKKIYKKYIKDFPYHILGLFNKTILLLKNNIIPIYVFDGKPPAIKNHKLEKRRNIKLKALEKLKLSLTNEDKIKYEKRSIFINKKIINECKELLDIMGIPYIMAPEEADSQCSYLAKKGYVDGVVTNDMDILTFGSPNIIKNILSDKDSTIINRNDMLQYLQLTYEQFVEWCCLLGTDYCRGVQLNPFMILKIYKQFHNMIDTINYLKLNRIKCDSIESYINAKTYFLNPKIIEPKNKLILEKTNLSNIVTYLSNKGLDSSKFKKKLRYLKTESYFQGI
jgi:flap endonuclease-1